MFKKTQVLVIDSDINILWAFKNFLLKNKIKMTGITTHEEAVNKLGEGDYDLILTDIRSDIDLELKFIQQVKRIKKSIPIIALTSYPDIINSNMLKPFGIDYLFVKPLDLAGLESAILKYLNKSLEKQTKKYD